jgi:hypothetical protein
MFGNVSEEISGEIQTNSMERNFSWEDNNYWAA